METMQRQWEMASFTAYDKAQEQYDAYERAVENEISDIEREIKSEIAKHYASFLSLWRKTITLGSTFSYVINRLLKT